MNNIKELHRKEGEIGISNLFIKLTLNTKRSFNDEDLLILASSIFGNDIAPESVLLSKIRIYFTIVSHLKDKTNTKRLAKILNKNFTCKCC